MLEGNIIVLSSSPEQYRPVYLVIAIFDFTEQDWLWSRQFFSKLSFGMIRMLAVDTLKTSDYENLKFGKSHVGVWLYHTCTFDLTGLPIP